MKSIIAFWLVANAFAATVLGQRVGHSTTTQNAVTQHAVTQQAVPAVEKWTTGRLIDFYLTKHNNFVVKAVLNDVDHCKLMFHTAVDSVSLTSTSTAALKSVKFTQKGNTTSWGGTQQTRFSPKNSLKIGDRTWTNLPITEDRFSGIGTDGKFGWGLFEGEIVEINFDRRQIKLHSELPSTTGFEKFQTEYDRGGMQLGCQITVGDSQVSHRFLMHSGFSGTALFDDDFTSKHQLHKVWKTSAGRELKDSLGNVIKTSKVIVPSMMLGSARLQGFPAELFPGDIGSQKQSVIGAEILKRFNIIVDVRGGQIFLKPNKTFKAPYLRS